MYMYVYHRAVSRKINRCGVYLKRVAKMYGTLVICWYKFCSMPLNTNALAGGKERGRYKHIEMERVGFMSRVISYHR